MTVAVNSKSGPSNVLTGLRGSTPIECIPPQVALECCRSVHGAATLWDAWVRVPQAGLGDYGSFRNLKNRKAEKT